MNIQAHTSDGDKGLEQRGRSVSMAAATSARGLPKPAVPDTHIGLPVPQPAGATRSHKTRLEPPEQVMLVGLAEP